MSPVTLLKPTLISQPVIQFLKTFALYGRDKRVAAIILVIGPVLAALAIVSPSTFLQANTSLNYGQWAVANQESEISLLEGCHKQLSRAT